MIIGRMNLQELTEQCHKMAVEKGWWDGGDRDPLVIAALIHSEVSEFVEEARVGAPAVYFNTPTGRVTSDDLAGEMNLKVGDVPQKPEGQLIELADVLIRMMDYCGRKGWDLEKAVKAKMDYNATRSHRHGGKLA